MNLMRFRPVFRMLINLWSPYLGAGISVRYIAEDWREITVAMKLRWYNQNYVGTHFGGSLFSMTDPFFMLMLLQNLGREYLVWDMAGTIKFIKPGKGTVTATFRLNDRMLSTIIEKTAGSEKHLQKFTLDIIDEDGDVVAKIIKTVYIRRKRAAGTEADATSDGLPELKRGSV